MVRGGFASLNQLMTEAVLEWSRWRGLADVTATLARAGGRGTDGSGV